MARNGQSHDEADRGHDQHVGATARLVDEKVRGPSHEFILCQRQIAKGVHLFFDPLHVCGALGFDKHVGDGVTGVRKKFRGPLVCGVQGGRSVETRRVHPGNSHDHPSVVVQFELRSHGRALELRELGIFHHDEGVLRVDVRYLSLQEFGPPNRLLSSSPITFADW